jgi:hypothetical protein
MKSWVNERKALLDNLFNEKKIVSKVSSAMYDERNTGITSEERVQFETLREQEREDYVWRRNLFFPVWVAGILLVDTLYVIPQTKTNRGRFFVHLLVAVPLITIATTGAVFKQQKNFPSHDYAADLCKKYGLDLDEDDTRQTRIN